ncbi:MAG TPA: protein kinase [Thermoanaerobaculia bacterium]|nr:protein kinase [Thermoanaerobaculia bacterium]
MSDIERPTEARPASAPFAAAVSERYEILDQVGKGGFGEVWKARDKTLGRLVAIKRVLGSATTDSGVRERLRREALSASALKHANICTVYDLITAGGDYFLVMEYLEGQTVHEQLASRPLPVERAVSVAAQVADALAEAHRSGIIHRDIKSSNIIVTPAGQAKVLDFGLAKQLERPAVVSGKATEMLLTREGTTVGTLHYMSPEQLLGETVDPRTDVFSLGVVLCEMLTGRLPFTGSSAIAVADAILHREPAVGDESQIPAPLRAIIAKALAKDRNQRYASAGELAADLRDLTAARTRPANWRVVAATAAALVIVAVVAAGWWWKQSEPERWARHEAAPEIDRLFGRDDYANAFRLTKKLQSIMPDHPELPRLFAQVSIPASINSTPAGAAIYWKRYDEPEQQWEYLGTTPLKNIPFPRGLYLQIEGRKEGHVTAHRLWPVIGASAVSRGLDIELLPAANAQPGMVLIPAAEKFTLSVPGLDHLPSVNVPAFFIDQYEVTNAQFKAFVDGGGYEKEEYWREPFIVERKTISWREAMKKFVDATGNAGPAMWELGTFPRGDDLLPVGGVSWYEASAYALFAGKRLPALHQWNRAALPQASAVVTPVSNFSGRGPEAVNSGRAMNGHGTFNMAGNVKEWCSTETESGKRFIVGGGWDEPNYMFIDSDAQSPWARRATYGFRCIRPVDPMPAALDAPVYAETRDYSKERPVGDDLFRAYLGFYSYDKTPLQARVVGRDSSSTDWVHEHLTMRAAYGNEELIVHLYLPKNARPPFQPVLYFPGSNAIHLDNFTGLGLYNDFLPRSGRALVFPIYKGTFERGDALNSDYPAPTSFYRDHLIAWTKDARRAIDYLETRDDIDVQKLSLVGFSWGGVVGPIIAAIEPRIRVCVFVVGGFCFQQALPEVDQVNFVPRVTQPTLMLNARYDHFFPVETSSRLMFQLLGTADDQKRFLLYDSGHALPRNEVIKETVGWLNRYLGSPAR